MSAQPNTMQLRFLQTMVEVSAEKNSTLIFPVPIDLLSSLKGFLDRGSQQTTS
jgi:hypothetical protein